MRALTLREFYEGTKTDPRERREDLYVVRDDRGQVLYVGISERGIWSRWFGQRGRMRRLSGGRWFGFDSVAQAVIDNMPQSWDWTIELWTPQECAEALGIEPRGAYERYELMGLEARMTDLLQPQLPIDDASDIAKRADLKRAVRLSYSRGR